MKMAFLGTPVPPSFLSPAEIPPPVIEKCGRNEGEWMKGAEPFVLHGYDDARAPWEESL